MELAVSDIAQLLHKWQRDILLFVRQVFEVEPSAQQRRVLVDLQDMVLAKIRVHALLAAGKSADGLSEREKDLNKKFGVSVMAGVGTGKGAMASWFTIWFLTCWPYPKIAVTSPSAKQLSITLWAELAKWHQKSKLKDFFVWQSDKYYWKEAEGRQWFAVTRTANTKNSAEEQAETLAGLHEDFLLIIGDEASGIPDPVFRPLETTLTRKCNLCLLLFNPTRSKGFAIETHRKDRANWVQAHWSAEESELVTKSSIQRLEEKYGRDSNTFRIRVLGLPPITGENKIIPWEYLENAIDRELEPMPEDVLMSSLDVGAGGDDSVLLDRIGPIIHPLKVANYEDPNLLTDWAVRHLLASDPKAILVDNIGVGWGVCGNLRKRIKTGADIIDVNVAQSAFNINRFHRLRDELWWRAREEFERGVISIPNDVLLCGDLNAPKYDEIAGKVKVESKREMKRRGVESPNRADALIQTEMYQTEFTRQLYGPKNSAKKKPSKSGGESWRTV